MVNGVVQCAPDKDTVAACGCKNNECSFLCAGVTCAGGLICDPTDGRCKQNTCLLPQFACADDQRCSLQNGAWQCESDPCGGVDCNQQAGSEGDACYCRYGECKKSCGKVTCTPGMNCVDGACVQDHCYGKSCAAGTVCNPADGACVEPG